MSVYIFCPLFDWIVYLFLVLSCLYILEINPLSVVSFAIIFSHHEGCLFTLFIVSFAVQKHLSWRNIPRFLGWKNQFCENDYTTRSNLYIQWDPYQITKTFFTELEQQQQKFPNL